LKKKIFSLLKIPKIKEEEPSLFKRIETLTAKLMDELSFVIEYPYVDRHYRDTYYSLYSSKFVQIDRDCLRIHLFEGKVNKDDIFKIEAPVNSSDENAPKNGKKVSKLSSKYYGFFIIRPLIWHMLGRSLISPKAFKDKEFVCCLIKDRVSLLGIELEVCGFPHTAQDVETHSCAESALWCLYEYYGSKYSQYKPLLPSQIIKPLQNNAEQRILPSRGLTDKELAKCLNSNGFQSLVYTVSEYSEDKPFYQLINIYIESGIPLLLFLEGETVGHAVLVIGHEENDLIYYRQDDPWAKYNSEPWVDVSLLIHKKLIFIDDNLPPYYSEKLEPGEKDSKPCLKYRGLIIHSFIVPLPTHTYLSAEIAYDWLKKVFDNPTVGFKKIGRNWITRLMLTSSHSFKKFISERDEKMDADFKKNFLTIAMPRFVWVCEIYEREKFVKDSYCSGLLIIDATGDGKSFSSLIFYTLDKYLFEHDDLIWKEDPIEIIPFKMQTYRNNLKGEWSKWTLN
jgi:hypothetical protein